MVLSPLAFCGVVVLPCCVAWGAVVLCRAVLCPLVPCCLVVPCCWAVLCVLLAVGGPLSFPCCLVCGAVSCGVLIPVLCPGVLCCLVVLCWLAVLCGCLPCWLLFFLLSCSPLLKPLLFLITFFALYLPAI